MGRCDYGDLGLAACALRCDGDYLGYTETLDAAWMINTFVSSVQSELSLNLKLAIYIRFESLMYKFLSVYKVDWFNVSYFTDTNIQGESYKSAQSW